jgi:predicted phage terminase large subunit-like protein
MPELTDEQRAAYAKAFESADVATLEATALSIGVGHVWEPRKPQLPPHRRIEGRVDSWFVWLFRAGRGSGKTRSAAEWVSSEIRERGPIRVCLVGPTFADGRDTMVEGESGLLAVLPRRLMPDGQDVHWNRSMGELHLADGSFVKVHSSERPGRLRGPQWHAAWVDEPAEFRDADLGITADTTWFNLVAGVRLGDRTRIAVTGTPKPVALIKALVERCERQATWVESRDSTYNNLENLAPAFRDEVVALYEGTSLGRQELHGELVEGGGDVFDPTWLHALADIPSGRRWRARCWDLAATEPHDGNRDPDWTVGTLLSIDVETRQVAIEHMARFRARPGRRDDLIRSTAIRDRERFGPNVRVFIEQEPGSGGAAQIAKLSRDLDGVLPVIGHRSTGSKYDRALPVAAAMEQGRWSVVQPAEIGDTAEWDLAALTAELREFRADDKHAHDDIVDTLSTFAEVIPTRGVRTFSGPVTDQKAPNRLI